MNPAWNRVVPSLFWLAAAAWPFDLLQYVPGAGISLLSMVALALLPALVLDAGATQKLKVPFEVLAPAALIVALAGIAMGVRGFLAGSGELVAALLLLVTTAHFAPPHQQIRRYLFVSLVSGVIVTLLTLVSPLAGLMPTAFSERSGVTFTFASSIPGGVHVLLTLALIAVYVVSDRRYTPVQRSVATAALLFLACALVGSAILWARDARALPVAAYPALSAVEIAAAVVALWLAARILAKVIVVRRLGPDRMHALWIAAIPMTFALCACAPLAPSGHLGLLLGLACATVLPARDVASPGRGAPLLAAVPLALAALNLAIVFPANTRDGRQYDAASLRDFEARDFGRLLGRLDTIERHAPGERRTHLWRARAALELGLPNLASFELARAIVPADARQLLDPPSDVEVRDFLVQIRDGVAAMPESQSVCAFERALLAQGERESTLYSLRLETAVALTHVESADSEPYAAAVAQIVGDPTLASDLEFWLPDELITLLMLWGAQTDDAPVPAGAAAPTVLVAQRTLDGLEIAVHSGSTLTRFRHTIPAPDARETGQLLSVAGFRWSAEEQDATGSRYSLIVDIDGNERSTGTVVIRHDGTARFEAPGEPVPVPFIPAVRLRVDG